MHNYKTPLRNAIEEYIEQDFSRMHMPGHKGVPSTIALGEVYDVTEVEGTDSLYEPTGCILELEKRFSELYCTEASLLSAGGSTLCIQAMLALVAKPNCTLIAGRNIHISAVNAMALLGINPYWVYPERNDTQPLIGSISPASIQAALKENPDAVGVYITSPDYFGVISDIKAISQICEQYDVPLLVDNAHGAHLAFVGQRMHPINLGASMCCDSLHKTLPVLTGGALLHIMDKQFISAAKRSMSLFGSTSPSYLIMLSADDCLGLLEQDLPLLIELTVARVQALKQVAVHKGFVLPDGMCDPMRLTLCLAASGISKNDFYNHLKSYRIMPEFISDNGCVLLFSPYNDGCDFDRINDAILSAPLSKPIPIYYPLPETIRAMDLRTAILSPKENILIQNAIGRVSAEVKAPCPPGIPLIMPGEVLTQNNTEILLQYGVSAIHVIK